MASSNPSNYEPRRSSLQIWWRVRIGVAAVVAIVVAVLLRVGLPVYRQHVAIREVERVGGNIETSPCGPEWLRSLLPENWLKLIDDVVSVDLAASTADADGGHEFGDSELVRIACLSELKLLWLSNTRVTDSGLNYTSRFTHLEALSLTYTRVTDAGMVQLAGLPDLQSLLLDHTSVSDRGLAEIGKLTKLWVLSLGETPISDAGLLHLAKLTKDQIGRANV